MIPIPQILKQYQDEHEVVAYQRTKYAITALLTYFGDKTTSDIDIPACRGYVEHRRQGGTAVSTTARELTVLRAACNHARKWRRLDNSEPPVFEIPKNLPTRDVWLFKDEIHKLIEHATCERVQDFIIICYETASRKTAIEELCWDQVSFSNRTISLSKVGEKDTKKRRPTVPMMGLESKLRVMKEEATNKFVLGDNTEIRYEFMKTCRAAGLEYVEQRDGRPAGAISPHTLRHSRITHLLEKGTSIYAVSKLTGITVTTIERTYGHINMSDLESELMSS